MLLKLKGGGKRGRYFEGLVIILSVRKCECVIFVYVFYNIKIKVIVMVNEEMM